MADPRLADSLPAESRPAETLLKSTTRHVRLFTARVEDGNLLPDPSQLTMDVDPDNEFLWDAPVLAKTTSASWWPPKPAPTSPNTTCARSVRSWKG
jgi:hypothetical protein